MLSPIRKQLVLTARCLPKLLLLQLRWTYLFLPCYFVPVSVAVVGAESREETFDKIACAVWIATFKSCWLCVFFTPNTPLLSRSVSAVESVVKFCCTVVFAAPAC